MLYQFPRTPKNTKCLQPMCKKLFSIKQTNLKFVAIRLTSGSCVFRTSVTVSDLLPIDCNHFKVSEVKVSFGAPLSILISV